MTMATASLSASFAVFLVRERANKSKHVQTVSGAPPSAFWGSVYLWDLINYALSAAGVPALLHQSCSSACQQASLCHTATTHFIVIGASLHHSAGLPASMHQSWYLLHVTAQQHILLHCTTLATRHGVSLSCRSASLTAAILLPQYVLHHPACH